MKTNKSIIKYLIWVGLALATSFFVIFKNGSYNHFPQYNQIGISLFAIFLVLLWGIITIFNKHRKTNYLLAVLFFSAIFGFTNLSRQFLSPTQLVAVVALFFYVAKVVKGPKTT